ncbi:MAG: hypothetical protein AAB483_00505, partial [Patescibacteria group bacterium]
PGAYHSSEKLYEIWGTFQGDTLMKKVVSLALVFFVLLLAGTPAIAGGGGNPENGTRTKNCQTDQYGTYCQVQWLSADGNIQRGHWEWTSTDGNSTSGGWWRVNVVRGISFGQTYYKWFSNWGGKG